MDEPITATDVLPDLAQVSQPALPRTTSQWLALAAIAGFFGLWDLSIVGLMDLFGPNDWGAIIVYFGFGVISAQCGLISVGLVWSDGRFWMRLLGHWLVVAGFTLLWFFGLLGNEGFRLFEDSHVPEFRGSIFSLPAIALAIQVPLWATRVGLGWRLTSSTTTARERPERPLSIADFFFGTTVVAVTLALARQSAADFGAPYWLAAAATAASLLGVSLVSVIPAGGWLLRMPAWRIGAVWLTIYALVAIAVTAGIVQAVGWTSRWEVAMLVVMLTGFGLWLAVPLGVLRALGYRLAR